MDHPRTHVLGRSGRVAGFSRRALLRGLGGVLAAGVLPAFPVRADTGPLPRGYRVVVIGAGLTGLVAAREIERRGGEAILLEARERVGGRAWTVRPGDRIAHLDEDEQRAAISDGLFLNVGPARIPSHHDQYLGLCRELGVRLEVLVNSSRSAFLLDKAGAGGAGRWRLRQAANDLRGHLSALLERALRAGALDQGLDAATRAKLVEFLRAYGDLSEEYAYLGSARSGLAQFPGATIERAVKVPPLTLDALLANPELNALLFEEDILMQATMLQPTGGMDRLPVALAAALRRPPRLGGEVREIRRREDGVRVVYRDRRGRDQVVDADRAIVTTPFPILARTPADFSPAVAAAIASVKPADAIKIGFESTPFWEADQIYGGISFTGGDTGLIWYPSGQFQAKRQMLLAAYATDEPAARLAAIGRGQRIEVARAMVDRTHPGHGVDLANPLAVHWAQVPFSEGAWVEWDKAGNDIGVCATLNAGDGPFLFAGSHISQYSGHWQEGAILSARYAVSRIAATA